MSIPVVDLSSADSDKLSREVVAAFASTGFLCITNHGIPDQVISNIRRAASEFFALPLEEKQKVSRRNGELYGYIGNGDERLNPERPVDFKECYNISARGVLQKFQPLPDEAIPTLRSGVEALYKAGQDLNDQLLRLIATGLGLESDAILSKYGKLADTSMAYVRFAFYPALEKDLAERQVRCGEHTDYGGLTFVFQDDVGGLQIKNRSGEFVDATPVPGGIYVNIGDLLQRWTADKLISTEHRVVMPPSDPKGTKDRLSVVFFSNPVDDCMVECLDGSGKYPPISAYKYIEQRVLNQFY